MDADRKAHVRQLLRAAAQTIAARERGENAQLVAGGRIARLGDMGQAVAITMDVADPELVDLLLGR